VVSLPRFEPTSRGAGGGCARRIDRNNAGSALPLPTLFPEKSTPPRGSLGQLPAWRASIGRVAISAGISAGRFCCSPFFASSKIKASTSPLRFLVRLRGRGNARVPKSDLCSGYLSVESSVDRPDILSNLRGGTRISRSSLFSLGRFAVKENCRLAAANPASDCLSQNESSR
jgi:hypothetical protein